MTPGWSISLHSYTKLFQEGLKLSMDLIDGHIAITIEVTGERLGMDIIRYRLNNFLIILLGPEHAVDVNRAAQECANFFHLLTQSDDTSFRCIIKPIHLISKTIPRVEHATISNREMFCDVGVW